MVGTLSRQAGSVGRPPNSARISGGPPTRNLALATFSVLGILISLLNRLTPPGRRMPLGPWLGKPEKKAANSQNCSFFQLAKGWAWHWAHSIFTPRKTRAVAPARFSGLFSLAKKKPAG